MAKFLEEKRLNCSSAWIRKYDNGVEYLRSFATDVVRKNQDGTYTRLWNGWSRMTCKHVHDYCGMNIRDIPFEDGHIEYSGYKREGRDLLHCLHSLPPQECAKNAKEFAAALKAGQPVLFTKYSTLLDKELKQIYKKNKSMLDLVDTLSMCANRKIKGNKPVNTLIKMKDFDFIEVWKGGLSALYPDIKL